MITRPSAFIVFSPAQSRGTKVAFTGNAATTVTVFKDSSFPGGAPVAGGPQNRRARINALFADLHADSMTWTAFKTDTGATGDDANYRWKATVP